MHRMIDLWREQVVRPLACGREAPSRRGACVVIVEVELSFQVLGIAVMGRERIREALGDGVVV